MKKLFSIFLLGLIFLTFASAEINSYAPIKQNEVVIIKQTCASCSYINISITYPNSSLAITNQPMVHQGGGVWTYDFNKTSIQGRYDVIGSGDLSGTPTSFDVLYFDVNEYGIESKSFMSYAFFYVCLIIISYVFIYKFATYNGKGVNDYNFFFWSAFLDLILFVLIQINGFGGVSNLLVNVIKMIAFGSGAYFLVQGIYYAVSWKKSNYT